MKNQNLTFTCPICGKIFSYPLYKRPHVSFEHHVKYCKWEQKFLEHFNITIDNLNELLTKYGSVLNLRENLPPELCPTKTCKYVYDIFKNHGIDTSIKRAARSEVKKAKSEQTNLKRYGSKHNFCKDHPSRVSWEKRLLETEGITNVFQRDEVKQKSIETMLAKYGVEHAAQSSQFVVSEQYMIDKYGEENGKKAWQDLCYSKGKSNRISYYIETYGEEEGLKKWKERMESVQKHYDPKSSKISKLNLKVKEALESFNISFTQEYCLWLDDVHSRYYDFMLDNKYIIEVNGDFYHANPHKYKANDLLNMPGKGLVEASDLWKYDAQKKELAEKHGFKILYIWEEQINNKESWNKILIKLKNYADSKNKSN